MATRDIRRMVTQRSVTIAASGNLSDAFSFRNYAGGVIHMPAAWTAASLGFKISSTQAGTFQPLYDDDGNLVQIDSPAVDQSYALPAALYGAHWVKLWSQDGSGSNTAQAAERALSIDLKG